MSVLGTRSSGQVEERAEAQCRHEPRPRDRARVGSGTSFTSDVTATAREESLAINSIAAGGGSAGTA